MQPGFPLRHLNEHARSVAEMLDKRALIGIATILKPLKPNLIHF